MPAPLTQNQFRAQSLSVGLSKEFVESEDESEHELSESVCDLL